MGSEKLLNQCRRLCEKASQRQGELGISGSGQYQDSRPQLCASFSPSLFIRGALRQSFLTLSFVVLFSALPAIAKIPVILSTDVGNEIDDQWAIVYLLTSPEFEVLGIVSAHSPTVSPHDAKHYVDHGGRFPSHVGRLSPEAGLLSARPRSGSRKESSFSSVVLILISVGYWVFVSSCRMNEGLYDMRLCAFRGKMCRGRSQLFPEFAMALSVSQVRKERGKGTWLLAGPLVLCLVIATGAQGQQQPSGAKPLDLVHQGRRFLQAKKPDEARRVLEVAVRQKPASAQAWVLLAAACTQLGQEQEAYRSYETVLKLWPNYPEALYNLGVIQIRRARFEEAAGYLQAFHRQRPQDSEALFPLAHCLFHLGKTSQGLEAVAKILASAENSGEIYSKVGQLLLANGLAQEAISPLETAFKLQPASEESRLTLALAESRLGHGARVVEILGSQPLADKPSYAILWGSSLCQLKRCNEAIPILEEALRRNFDQKQLYLSLASAYAGASRPDQATRLLQDAHARWPEDRDVRLKLAKLRLLSGNANAALHLLIGKEGSPAPPEEQAVLVQCYLALNQVRDAQQIAEQAVATGDPPEGLLIALANTYQLQARDQDVIALLERYRTRFSDSASYLFTLALSYYNRGNYSVALEMLADVIVKDPRLAQAYYITGSCLASMGKPADAIPYYESAVGLAPENSLYHFHLGLVLSMVGKKDLAEEQLSKSVELNGSHAPARYELAKIYFDNSRDELAREQLEEAIKVSPDFESSYYLLSRVHSRQGRREEATARLKEFQLLQQKRREEERALKARASGSNTP